MNTAPQAAFQLSHVMHMLLSQMVHQKTNGLLVDRREVLFTIRPHVCMTATGWVAAWTSGVRITQSLEGLNSSTHAADGGRVLKIIALLGRPQAGLSTERSPEVQTGQRPHRRKGSIRQRKNMTYI